MTDIMGMRAQILANAKILIRPGHNKAALTDLLATRTDSAATLLNANYYGDIDVIVWIQPQEGLADVYQAAVMVGTTPAIEGGTSKDENGALKKLLTATAFVMGQFIPRVGHHQRTIHGGGVFDEDLISKEIIEARRKASVVSTN